MSKTELPARKPKRAELAPHAARLLRSSSVLAFALMFAFAIPYFTANKRAQGQGTTWKGVEKFPPKVQAILKTKACLTCHQIGSVGMGKLGPNLRDVGTRRNSAWLTRWIKNPPAMKPGTAMPPNQLTPAELKTMVSFLLSQRRRFSKTRILDAHKDKPAMAGKRLVRAYDCLSCHKIAGKGGTLTNTAPDLKDVSKRHPAAWLEKWLRNPQTVKRGTFMPTFGFSKREINALVAYLQTL